LIHASYLNALYSDANVTMGRHAAPMRSRGVEVEMFGETSWKKKVEDEHTIIYITRRTQVSCHDCPSIEPYLPRVTVLKWQILGQN
jgi:hypothetical protein